MYEHLENNIAGCDFRFIWSAKLPLKIQIFLWQLFQDAIITRDVMSRRKWKGNPRCSFCLDRETSQHLCFSCPVARVVWRTVGCMVGTNNGPDNLWQFYAWCFAYMPNELGFILVVWRLSVGRCGIAAIARHLKKRSSDPLLISFTLLVGS